MFAETSRFKDAVRVANQVDKKRFGLVLQRLIGALGNSVEQGRKFFTEAEEVKLRDLLKLSQAELATLLEACAYIFETAAYERAKADRLHQDLTSSGIDAEHAAAFVSTWNEGAKSLV